MAYLILADAQGEFDRRELTGPVVVGRALDCEICVRDILLSRKHCRIEPFDDRWVVSDLGSKNGSRIGGEVITRHVLADGEVVRIGKVQICYRVGAFVPLPKAEQRRRDVRPTDPKEALSGTVLGFQLFDMEEDSRVSGFPIPKPKPPEPASMGQEAVTSMVTQMASDSWDAILSESKTAPKKKPAKKAVPAPKVQTRPAPEPAAKPDVHPKEILAPVSLEILAPVAQEILAPAPQRSETPISASTIPVWLAGLYVLLACVIGIGCLALIVWKSNPVFNLPVR